MCVCVEAAQNERRRWRCYSGTALFLGGRGDERGVPGRGATVESFSGALGSRMCNSGLLLFPVNNNRNNIPSSEEDSDGASSNFIYNWQLNGKIPQRYTTITAPVISRNKEQWLERPVFVFGVVSTSHRLGAA